VACVDTYRGRTNGIRMRSQGSKLVQSYTRGGYIGMHTSDCICVFRNGTAREKERDGWRLGHRREIQAAETRLLHYSEAAAFELVAELATSSLQHTRNERINLLNASRPILAFWYYFFFFFPVWYSFTIFPSLQSYL